MPLYENAAELVRANLQQFSPTKKVKVKAVVIGVLTETQLAALHAYQDEEQLPRSNGEVLFHGWHIYKSRILKDGYEIDDVIDQITSAMNCNSVLEATDYMTSVENPFPRVDRYGNSVNDRAVFECTARHPRPELYSVIPKGDARKPSKRMGPAV